MGVLHPRLGYPHLDLAGVPPPSVPGLVTSTPMWTNKQTEIITSLPHPSDAGGKAGPGSSCIQIYMHSPIFPGTYSSNFSTNVFVDAMDSSHFCKYHPLGSATVTCPYCCSKDKPLPRGPIFLVSMSQRNDSLIAGHPSIH